MKVHKCQRGRDQIRQQGRHADSGRVQTENARKKKGESDVEQGGYQRNHQGRERTSQRVEKIASEIGKHHQDERSQNDPIIGRSLFQINRIDVQHMQKFPIGT